MKSIADKVTNYEIPRLKPEYRAHPDDPWTPSQKAKEETSHMKHLLRYEGEEE